MFLEKKVSVARLTIDGSDSDKESYVTVTASIPMNIQPATPELTAVSEGVYGQVFRAFTPASGIYIGDRVTVSGTNDQFIVKGVNDWNFGPLPHLELVLFKGDN